MTSYRRKSGLFSISILLIITLLGAGSSAHAGKITQYKFGVFPFMPMAALIKYYNSVSMDFTRRVNKRVIAQTRPTFKEFSEEIEKETYDIIFIQPFDYPKAYAHNYRPLARRSEPLDAILVTRTDAPIKSIKDLKGKTLVNPPKEAAISQVIKKELMNSGIDWKTNIKIIYTRNHFACIQMVLVSQADACSTTTPVLHHWQNTRLKKKKLHIIHQAESVPHTLYMAHKRVPDEDKEKFKEAILTWDNRPEGKMILKIFNLHSFVEAKDSEYDVIRNYWKKQ
ncbi:MAG: phosphate/phosphite/phosphonate ABC transporter substrate-binding protein [Gammaproteobacteria bacterium]|jgi:phosphonate transport system substrate-binding protein